MTNNFYWTVYKNLEKELIELSNLIHIDDNQLTIYSVKIAELLLRTSVEIESISKTLYFQNGGTKPNDINLFFDTDCLDLLETKFQLSKKQVQVSAPNFYFSLPEQITKQLAESQITNQEEINEKIKSIVDEVKNDSVIQVARETGQILKDAIDNLRYEAVLNKHQY